MPGLYPGGVRHGSVYRHHRRAGLRRRRCPHLARLRADPCLSPAEGRLVVKARQEGGSDDGVADVIVRARMTKPGAQARDEPRQAARIGADSFC